MLLLCKACVRMFVCVCACARVEHGMDIKTSIEINNSMEDARENWHVAPVHTVHIHSGFGSGAQRAARDLMEMLPAAPKRSRTKRHEKKIGKSKAQQKKQK